LVAACAFANCAHLDEPDCAVIAAVERGDIDPGRYESYVRMRLGDAD
jgi:ribosome biogenesis GTPase